MKLESKPKAVKFRIRSGNVEHNSLDTLKKNFVWEDIVPLLDGRLAKWLERLKKSDIAKKLNDLEFPESHILQVYNILFRTDKDQLSSIDEVFAQYSKDVSLISVIRGVAPTLTINEILRYAGKYDSMIEILIATPLSKIKENSATVRYLGNDVYDLAMFLSEKGYNQDVVMNLMTYASSKGVAEATDFINQKTTTATQYSASVQNSENTVNLQESIYKRVVTLYELLDKSGIVEQIENSWKSRKVNSQIDTKQMAGPAKCLFDFSNTCLSLYKTSQVANTRFHELDSLCSEFRACKKDDFLYEEKMFVAALFESYKEDSIKRLTDISYYPPAKKILDSETKSFSISNHTYQLNWRENNGPELKFYVLNLLKFWNLDGPWVTKHAKNSKLTATQTLRSVLSDRKIINRIKKSWSAKSPILDDCQDPVLKNLYEFSNVCLEIAKIPGYDENVIRTNVRIWENVSPDDPLYFEKQFMQVLFLRNGLALPKLDTILDYPPAKRMYANYSHTVTVDGHKFMMGEPSNKYNIEYFVTNLLKFRDL